MDFALKLAELTPDAQVQAWVAEQFEIVKTKLAERDAKLAERDTELHAPKRQCWLPALRIWHQKQMDPKYNPVFADARGMLHEYFDRRVYPE